MSLSTKPFALVVLIAAAPVFSVPTPWVPVHDSLSNGYVHNWLICGPFPNPTIGHPKDSISRSGFNDDYLSVVGGEARCRPVEGMKVRYDSGTTVVFRKASSPSPTLDLLAAYEKEYSVAYAFTTIVSGADRRVYAHLGSDDGVKVFLNGKIVLEHFANRGQREHNDVFTMDLKKGVNTVLVKVDQGSGGWSVIFQTLDRAHHAAWARQAVASALSVAVNQNGAFGERLSAVLLPGIATMGVLDSVKASWNVINMAGDTVGRAQSLFSDTASIVAPQKPGYYTVHASLVGLSSKAKRMCIISPDRNKTIQAIVARAKGRLTKSTGLGTEGMIAYRMAQFEGAMTDKSGNNAPDGIEIARELEMLMAGTAADTLRKTRGRFEWAYRSKVDGTGQPFTITVPGNYDTTRAWPLRIYLHGSGMTHQPYPDDSVVPLDNPYIYLYPLGRSRSGKYMSLSEVDILEAITFVRSHWRIDSLRIHLDGGSMGGGGTFKIASRHPDLFASASPECGYGEDQPVENLLHVPVYSMHSIDDPDVPIVESRLPLQAVARQGYQVIFDEQNGYGHGIWQCAQCKARRDEWERRQVRPSTVDEIRYTAEDESANGAYWARAIEWGPRAVPARFHVRIGSDNGMYVTTENVGVLAMDLSAAPVDHALKMQVVVEGRLDTVLTAPLPDSVFLTFHSGLCTVAAKRKSVAAGRLHFPGGLAALYHGEPLLIVWGTRGSKVQDSLLHAQAEMGRYAVRSKWLHEARNATYETMFIGSVPTKPDSAVTAADLATCNIIVLGTAVQNSLVARIATKLPISIANGTVTSNDNISWSFKNRALGLLYRNPLAPSRLVYWIAAGKLAAAESGLSVLQGQEWTTAGPDFYLVDDSTGTTVARRCFRPDWSWEQGYAQSPKVPASLSTGSAIGAFAAEALRAATYADYAMPPLGPDDLTRVAVPGETRLADLLDGYAAPAALFTIRGDSLLSRTRGASPKLAVVPVPDSLSVKPGKWYTIACPNGWAMGDYTVRVHETPDSIWCSEWNVSDALQAHAQRKGW